MTQARSSMLRPLDRLPTIRAKLASVIVFAVAVAVLLMSVLVAFALRKTYQSTQHLNLQTETQAVAAAGFNAQGEPTAALRRLLNQYGRKAIVVDPAGRAVLAQFAVPPTVSAVLAGQTDTGTVGNLEYYGYPVIRHQRIVGAVYLARPVGGHGVVGMFRTTVAFVTSLGWQLLLAGFVAAVIALALARLLARGMTSPIREMALAADRISKGDYAARVGVESRDELGRLAQSFNKMAADMADLERLRRDLVANVSHELKTPISALRAHLENLLDGVEAPDRETMSIMLDQSERLGRLVEELLDLSRLESGDVPLHLEAVSLGPLVGQVGREVEVSRPDRRVHLRNEVPDTLPPVEADPERVHQVLFNLLDNAFRFSPPDAAVTVRATRVNGSCEVSVEDAGPGIPEEHRAHVFDRFYRVDAGRSRDDGGTGIGLTIVRSVVEAHGGRIWVEQADGGGSRFRFVLPVAGPALPAIATKEET